MTPGPRNSLTDIAGLTVGHATEARVKSGVTVVFADKPVIAGAHVMGGAPGTRETDLLAPEQTVGRVDAIALSGGSVFGLDAAGGVVDALAASGRGFAVGPVRAPIVPGAILFDLLNGGDKNWGAHSPYRDLGTAALKACAMDFALGSVGAGTGATVANLKGGLGTASVQISGGITVAALAVVNALGQATIGTGPHFWAAPFEIGKEFGGLGLPAPLPSDATALATKLGARDRANTTIAIIATDAVLGRGEAKRVAMVAHDGFARALWPAHTPLDGDIVFAISTGEKPLDPATGMLEVCAAAGACMARAIARGVYEATAAPADFLPAWRDKFGR
jgi:L-aminopeptidase/D-esterase-like protein